MEKKDGQLLSKRFRQSLVSYTFRQIIVMLLTIVYNIVLTRYLMPEEFGRIAIVSIVITVSTLFADGGLGVYLIQRHAEVTCLDINRLSSLQLVISIAFILLCFLMTGIAMVVVPDNPVGWLIAIASLSLPFIVLRGAALIEMERSVQLKKVVLVELLEEGVFAFTSVFMAYNGFGAWSIVIAQILKCILGYLLARSQSRFKFSFIRLKLDEKIKVGLRFGMHYQVAQLLNMVRVSINPMFIIPLLGLQAGGYVERSWYLAGAALSVISAVQRKVVFPYTARLQHDHAKVRNLIESSVYISAVIDKFLFLPLLIFADEIVLRAFGSQWVEMLPLLYLLLIGNAIFGSLSGSLYPIINGIGFASIILKFNWYTLALSWMLTVPLVLWLGLTGVGFASIALWVLVHWLKTQLASRVGGFLYYSLIFKQLIAASASCIIVRGLFNEIKKGQTILELIIWSVFSWLIYVIILSVLDWARLKKGINYY